MQRFILALALMVVTAAAAAAAPEGFVRKPVVGLDYYYNHQVVDGQQQGPIWENRNARGLSHLGDIIRQDGAATDAVWAAAASPRSLRDIDAYVLPVPAMGDQSANDLGADDIEAIVKWVERGGTLLVLGNGDGEALPAGLAQLLSRFGIAYAKADGAAKAAQSDHPVMAGIAALAPISKSAIKPGAAAKAVYGPSSGAQMVECRLGKGKVMALAAPWLVNEHIQQGDNQRLATNLVAWLAGK